MIQTIIKLRRDITLGKIHHVLNFLRKNYPYMIELNLRRGEVIIISERELSPTTNKILKFISS